MKKPKLIMTLLVRDEVDILRYNIEFHLKKGVDFIVATDNGSVDGTRDILREYEDSGILHLIDEREQDFSQALWVNRMAMVAHEQYKADIIFHCDADEFWFPRSGNLKTEISIKPLDILRVDEIHVLLQDKNGKEKFPEDTKYAVVSPIEPNNYLEETLEKNFYLYRHPPKVMFKTSNKLFEVSDGNHSVVNSDTSIIEGHSNDLIIYHFPVRNRTQFFHKIIKAGSAFERNKDTQEIVGFQLKRWYKNYKDGLLDKEYKSILLQERDIDTYLSQGLIEAIDFNHIVRGEEHHNDSWMFFNRRFEYDQILDFKEAEWYGHAFFAYDLVRNLKPKVIVQLGTQEDHSFLACCQAVKDGCLDTELSAIDTWVGDEPLGFYDELIWDSVNRVKESCYDSLHLKIIRNTSDQTVNNYIDSSIDILFIGRFQTYDAAKNHYEKWVGKVKSDGIILFHNITVKDSNCSNSNLWDELKEKYFTFEFNHSQRLGVLCKSSQKCKTLFNSPTMLKNYYQLMFDKEIHDIRLRQMDMENANLNLIIGQKEREISQKDHELVQKEQQLQIMNFKNFQVQGQLNHIHNSISWGITAPLRRFKHSFPTLSRWIKRYIFGKLVDVSHYKHTMIQCISFNELVKAEFANVTIGIHLHLFYIDLLNEIVSYLENVPFKYNLYVSITDDSHTERVRKKLNALKTVETCTISVVTNRGRDIAPFVVTFAEELLKHDYICHIHSKKSLYTGDQQVGWRKHLFDNLLGSPSIIRSILGLFDAHNEVGLVYPETYPALPYWAHCWLGNRHIGQQLCDRFMASSDFASYLDAPMGTMFWARTNAIRPILSARFSFEDFPEESGQNDGTLAHAMERMLVPVALTQDFTFSEISSAREEFSVSFGSRNLSQYWQKNSDDLKAMIMQHTVISFDIFDTLLTRPLLDPDSVFDLLSMEAERTHAIKNFREIRKRAEYQIRAENRFGSDIGIAEIYQRIGFNLKLDKSVSERLCAQEKAIEILLNGPRTEMVNALKFAKLNNKRIILMSDMYLDQATVRELLAKNWIDDYDELYLSSELGVRKDDGSMWIKVLEKYQKSSILHIGDNEHSDVQIPSDLGIHTYHVMSPKNIFYNSTLGREFSLYNKFINVCNSAFTGTAISVLFNDPFILHSYEGDYIFSNKFDFGYAVIGPIVLSYLLWLLNSSRKSTFSTVVFLAREGYLLKKLFDNILTSPCVGVKLERRIKSIYLLASRRATIVPTIKHIDDAITLLKKTYAGGIYNLFESRFGLSRDYLQINGFTNTHVELPNDVDKVAAIAREHFDAIHSIARKERVNYMRYLNDQGLTDAKDGMAVSDIGYSGNIQKALASLLGVPLTGYYFATSNDIFDNDKHANRFYGYFTENDDQTITECPVYKYSLVLESILTAPDGQLICFTDEGEMLRPVFASRTKKFDEIVQIQDGIAGYCNDMIKYFGRYILDFEPDKNVSQYLFQKVISKRQFDPNLSSLFKIEDNYCNEGEIGALQQT
jgi:FMN phosphatase YigB (HAD superfamily)